MSADLSAFCEAARREPLAPRKALHEALREAKVAVLADGRGEDDDLPVWAERDPVLGGMWIPIFSSEERAQAAAVRSRHPLRAACGSAAELFAALLAVPRFAGVRLDPGHGASVRLERRDVYALADGLLPGEAPALHELDTPAVALPEGLPCRFGEADPAFGPAGRRVVFPAAPGLTLQDFRALVRLELGGAPAWAPCRNFAAALASAPVPNGGRAALDDILMDALVSFGMYGEAEALCARSEGSRRAWALGHLGRVLRRSGRLDECVKHCRSAIAEAPDEARLYRSLAQACAELEDMEGARDAARRGLERLPDDPALRRFL